MIVLGGCNKHKYHDMRKLSYVLFMMAGFEKEP
jgi:hypothetical protein